jgi:hypothetical protein
VNDSTKHRNIVIAAGQKDGQITSGLISTVLQDFGHPCDVVGISLEMEEGGGWLFALTVERMLTVDGKDGRDRAYFQQVTEIGEDGIERGVTYKERYLVRSLFIDAVRAEKEESAL